jgi:cysteine desulfurase
LGAIYLDNNATTAVAPEVVEVMMPFFEEHYGNPSSLHETGRKVREAVENARSQLASLINCSESELIFTSGGTESINSAISACVGSGAKRKLVISSVEHVAVEDFAESRKNFGVEVTRVGVDENGQIDLQKLEDAIDDEVSLVSVIWGHNETGILSPVLDVAKLCHEKGVLLHLDGVQAVGKIKVDLKELQCDLLSISAHKLHGPKGVGALFVRDGIKLNPYHIGGGQEQGRRAGTEAVANVVGLGKACELALESLEENARIVSSLRDRFESEISQKFSFAKIIGEESERLPNTSKVCFEGFEAETLLPLLDIRGICVSHGAACSSGSWGPPRVLSEMGFPDEWAKGSVRFSWSKYNECKDILIVLDALEEVFSLLQ